MARRAERTLGNISTDDPPIASLARLHSAKMTLGLRSSAFLADRDLASATRRAYRATYGSLLQAFGPEMPVTALDPRPAPTLAHPSLGKGGPGDLEPSTRRIPGSCRLLPRARAGLSAYLRPGAWSGFALRGMHGQSPSRRSMRCGHRADMGCARKPCGAALRHGARPG